MGARVSIRSGPEHNIFIPLGLINRLNPDNLVYRDSDVHGDVFDNIIVLIRVSSSMWVSGKYRTVTCVTISNTYVTRGTYVTRTT